MEYVQLYARIKKRGSCTQILYANNNHNKLNFGKKIKKGKIGVKQEDHNHKNSTRYNKYICVVYESNKYNCGVCYVHEDQFNRNRNK